MSLARRLPHGSALLGDVFLGDILVAGGACCVGGTARRTPALASLGEGRGRASPSRPSGCSLAAACSAADWRKGTSALLLPACEDEVGTGEAGEECGVGGPVWKHHVWCRAIVCGGGWKVFHVAADRLAPLVAGPCAPSAATSDDTGFRSSRFCVAFIAASTASARSCASKLGGRGQPCGRRACASAAACCLPSWATRRPPCLCHHPVASPHPLLSAAGPAEANPAMWAGQRL